jgi:hypothetical protein
MDTVRADGKGATVTGPADISADILRTTRASLHAVAEHVMAASQFAQKRRIGLRQATGGFATQPFVVDDAERRVAVVRTELVVRDDVRGKATERREPITSLQAAGQLAGGPVGMPSDAYRPSPMPDPDAELAVDPDAAVLVADFYALVQAALTVFAAELVAEGPSEIQLWPEHFDLATTVSEANYGGSPGDAEHDRPYLYVGPFDPPPRGGFWNEPFGASRDWREIDGVGGAVRFFHDGRAAKGDDR